ncbi:MAG TPA: trehalose-phosphatase [Streptosporangiaceae bacterium]|jgi:trehalose 6-phosphate phosphatase
MRADIPPALRPGTPQGRAGLAALLADPGHALLGLDFDGTLAPIVPDPRDARAHPGAAAALRALAGRLGTLAIITGRPAAKAVEYGGLASVPGLLVFGHYGFERWSGGEVATLPTPPGVEAARGRLPGTLAAVGAPPGTWTEDKGHAVAVHTRRTGDPEGALRLLRPALEELAAAEGLLAQPGRMVIELRPAGMDKGAALTAIFNERLAHAVAFCGDDLGDLPAFDAIGELRGSGVPGLAVCSGSTEVTELAEAADLVLDGPDGVVAWLEWLAGQAGT